MPGFRKLNYNERNVWHKVSDASSRHTVYSYCGRLLGGPRLSNRANKGATLGPICKLCLYEELKDETPQSPVPGQGSAGAGEGKE